MEGEIIAKQIKSQVVIILATALMMMRCDLNTLNLMLSRYCALFETISLAFR